LIFLATAPKPQWTLGAFSTDGQRPTERTSTGWRTSDFDSSRLSRNAEDVPPPPSRSANSVPGKVASRYRSEAVLDLPGAQRGRATTCGSPRHAPRNADPTPGKTAIQWGTDGVFRTTRAVLHGVFGTGHRVLHGVFRTTRAVLHGVFGTGQRVLNGVCARRLAAFPRIKDARLNASQRRGPGSETYLFTKKGLLAFLEGLPR
jgi:hypothetical protein